MLVSLFSLLLDYSLQLGRWTEWQGAPGPLTQWAAGSRAQPLLDWGTSEENTSRLVGMEHIWTAVTVVGDSRADLRVRGGQSCEPGQGCDSLRPVALPGGGLDASLPFSVAMLNADRTGL